MTTLPQHRAAEALERFLGDPNVAGNRTSFARAVEHDEREALPDDALAKLAAGGFPAYFVPEGLGGKLGAYDEQLALWRVVARRDLTAAVVEVISFIGATPVWVAGSPDQQRAVAARLADGQPLAFALTERAHGSDLLAGQASATAVADGYQLDGEKWLIGNGQRSRAVSLFVRSEPSGGPAGFSMLLVDRAALPPGSCRSLPRERTMGLRGMDLSGLAFDAARVPATAAIGEPGHGLEILLRAQQLARLAICGLSLGGADTALRSVARFATDRVLYGAPITALPYVRDRLVGALLDIYIGEAVVVAGFRGVHAAADQLALWTAIAKAVVPTRLDQAVIELRLVLGARYHLRTGHADGMFQKVLRDHLVLAVVEGSTAVNLKSIATQLRGLARRALRPQDPGEQAARTERLAIVFGLDRPLPPVSLHELTIAAGRDDITAGIADAAREPSAPGELGAQIHALIATLAAELDAVYRAVAALPTRYGQAQRSTAELTALAERYATLHAAACCVHLWRFTLACDDPTWLALCLSRLVAPTAPVPAAWTEHVLARLAAQLDGDQLFSLCTLNLAGDATLEETP